MPVPIPASTIIVQNLSENPMKRSLSASLARTGLPLLGGVGSLCFAVTPSADFGPFLSGAPLGAALGFP